MRIFFKAFNKIILVIFIKKILNICFVIIGTIIGAGFASGKEIYTFFCINGIYGLYGLLISNILISLIIYISFNIVLRNNIKTFSEYLHFLVGNNNILTQTLGNIINVFLFVSFVIMVSGFGTYFFQEFNIKPILGSLIICIFSIIAFFKNINGIIKINSILIPSLVLLILFLGVKCIPFNIHFNNIIINYNSRWIISSILYASYNSIVLIPIIISLSTLIKTKNQIKFITFLTLIFMIIISCIIFIILSANMPEINNIDIPIIYIATQFR